MIRNWHIGLTQRFLLFFVLTAILPIVIVGGLFLHSLHHRFDERVNTLLSTGKEMTLGAIENDQEKLESAANQAAYLTINEPYQAYLEAYQGNILRAAMKQLERDKSMDIIALLDRQGHLITSKAFSADSLNRQSLKKMEKRVFSGQSARSIEMLPSAQDQSTLFYLSMVPVFAEDSTRPVAALVIGKSLVDSFLVRFQRNQHPELRIRIFQQNHLIFSSIPSDRSKPGQAWRSDQTQDETINGVEQETLSFPLLNKAGTPVAKVVISTPDNQELLLEKKGLIYSLIYILLGLCGIGLAGAWFHYSFVKPMNAIATASATVAQGNLDVRVSDVGSQREVSEAIQHFNCMLDRLQDDEQLRDTFIATLTHDLRTPLLAERRVLEMFEEYQAELPTEYIRLSQGLLDSNRHLLRMVSDLLETYQYEAGQVPLYCSDIRLTELLKEAIAKLAPLAEAKHIVLVLAIPDSFPVFRGDAHQLQRVFINLISNAIENIDENSQIEIQAHVTATMVEIEICDNGPGIPPDLLPHLFERYITGHPTRQQIGSGLGLYICKMIVERHSGTIEVRSDSNLGACFIIRLPAKENDYV